VGNNTVPPGAVIGRVVGFDPIDANTRLWAPVVQVWWEGQECPEKLAVNQLLPAGLNPLIIDDDGPAEKNTQAMAAGVAIAVGGSSARVSVANEEGN
jgi:hypothetical protein